MPARRARPFSVVATVALTVVVTMGLVGGCGGTDTNTLRVGAAASLTEVMNALGRAFADEAGSGPVEFTFASSSDVARQIVEGAPVDVFASADRTNMARVEDAGLVNGPSIDFAGNRLVIVVEEGNPLGIDELSDLGAAGLIVIGCAPGVPIATYTTEVLARAGVAPNFASFEENVRAIVTKVALGEADVGVVYATDVPTEDPRVDAVTIPDTSNVSVTYPIAVTSDDPRAREFVDFVLSDRGRAILRRFGFSAP